MAQRRQRGAPIEDAKPLTIANLPEAERSKISRLVERLVTLGREHEDVVTQRDLDKQRFKEELDKIIETMTENDKKNCNEIINLKNNVQVLEAKCGLAYGLLKIYQEKLQNLLDLYEKSKSDNNNNTNYITMLNEDIKRLESLVFDQKTSIKRYADEAKKRDLIQTSPSAKYTYEIKTLEMEKRYNELEKKYKESEKKNQELEKSVKESNDKAKKDIERGKKELEDAVIMLGNQLTDTKRIITDKNEKCSRLEKEISILTEKLNNTILNNTNSIINPNMNEDISNLISMNNTNNDNINITSATDIENSTNYFDDDNDESDNENENETNTNTNVNAKSNTNNDILNTINIDASSNTHTLIKKKKINININNSNSKGKSPYYSKTKVDTSNTMTNTSISVDNIIRNSNSNISSNKIKKKKSKIDDNNSYHNSNIINANNKSSPKRPKKVKNNVNNNITKVKRTERLAYEIGVNGEYDNSLFELLDGMNIE